MILITFFLIDMERPSLFNAFIVEKNTNNTYTCISDHKGKIVIRSSYLTYSMPDIKRGIFIQCQEGPQKHKNTKVEIYNPLQTTVLSSVAPWTHQYVYTMHLIYIICASLGHLGLPNYELWNLIVPLSWDINPQPGHLYRLLLYLCYQTESMPYSLFFEKEIIEAYHEKNWYEHPLKINKDTRENLLSCIHLTHSGTPFAEKLHKLIMQVTHEEIVT